MNLRRYALYKSFKKNNMLYVSLFGVVLTISKCAGMGGSYFSYPCVGHLI